MAKNTTLRLAEQAQGHRQHAKHQHQQGDSVERHEQQGDHMGGEAFGDVGRVPLIDEDAEALKKRDIPSV